MYDCSIIIDDYDQMLDGSKRAVPSVSNVTDYIYTPYVPLQISRIVPSEHKVTKFIKKLIRI